MSRVGVDWNTIIGRIVREIHSVHGLSRENDRNEFIQFNYGETQSADASRVVKNICGRIANNISILVDRLNTNNRIYWRMELRYLNSNFSAFRNAAREIISEKKLSEEALENVFYLHEDKLWRGQINVKKTMDRGQNKKEITLIIPTDGFVVSHRLPNLRVIRGRIRHPKYGQPASEWQKVDSVDFLLQVPANLFS